MGQIWGLKRMICIFHATFGSSNGFDLIFITPTRSNNAGFSNGFLFVSGGIMKPVDAVPIVINNGNQEAFMRYTLHRTFAIALIAMTDNTRFENILTRTIAFATSYYI